MVLFLGNYPLDDPSSSNAFAIRRQSQRWRRHGSNPGTVGLTGQSWLAYEALHGVPSMTYCMRRVLYGISCRNYAAAAEAIPIDPFRTIPLSGEDVVALASRRSPNGRRVGITMTGDKRFLVFVETDTENEQVVEPAPPWSSGASILVIVDGGNAARHAFRHRQWHNENVALPGVSSVLRLQPSGVRRGPQPPADRTNRRPALAEGLDETLTFHRLGVMACWAGR